MDYVVAGNARLGPLTINFGPVYFNARKINSNT